MTERTTPITVHLTEKQMDYIQTRWLNLGGAHNAIAQAIRAQRPRPIAVGDRVNVVTRTDVAPLTVEAIKDQSAWLWWDGGPWGSRPLFELARVDEATA